MNKRKHIIIFTCILLALAAMLVWGGLRFYGFEKKHLVQKTENIVKAAADSVQVANTTLNNIMMLDNDSERAEKIAFAIGMAGNMGKLRLYFNEGDTIQRPKEPDTAFHIDRDFLTTNHISFLPHAVKTIRSFDTVFRKKLYEERLLIPYTIHHISPNDKTKPAYSFTSAPFVINFYDPSAYNVYYDMPLRAVLPGLMPYIIISIILLSAVIAAFVFYYRTYSIQLQMATFRESLFSNITHELKRHYLPCN